MSKIKIMENLLKVLILKYYLRGDGSEAVLAETYNVSQAKPITGENNSLIAADAHSRQKILV